MEVPEHLLQRAATHRDRLAQQDMAEVSEVEAASAIAEVVEALPTQCQDCVFRPTSAGGNNGCVELNQTYGVVEGIERTLHLRSDWRSTSSFSPVMGIALGLQLLTEARQYERDVFTYDASAALQSQESSSWDAARTSIGHVSLAAKDTTAFLRSTFAVEDVGTRDDTPSPEGIEVHLCIRSLSDKIQPEKVADRDGYAEMPKMVKAARAITAAKDAGVSFS